MPSLAGTHPQTVSLTCRFAMTSPRESVSNLDGFVVDKIDLIEFAFITGNSSLERLLTGL